MRFKIILDSDPCAAETRAQAGVDVGTANQGEAMDSDEEERRLSAKLREWKASRANKQTIRSEYFEQVYTVWQHRT